MLKILLTNDDGIDAPGLSALRESVVAAVEDFRPGETAEIVTVAPDRCRSECGHSIETNASLKVKTLGEGRHSITGTPVDCIRVARYALNFVPDVVFSGINAGANLGVNLMVSGTFAAAREASVLGIPALAASHYRHPDVPKTWGHTPAWMRETLVEFLQETVQRSSSATSAPLWNVNLPAITPEQNSVPTRAFCKVDSLPLDRTGRVDEQGNVVFDLDYHARPRVTGSDVDLCFTGQITVSKVDPHVQSN